MKNAFEESTVTYQTWWATDHEPKKDLGIETPLESFFGFHYLL